ncbi:MAG: serine hydrolase domain-containing protein [Pseudomonadota bacterium]
MGMDRRTFLGATALGAGVAITATTQSGAKSSRSGGVSAKALRDVERYMEQHLADWGLVGMTLCVVDREGGAGRIGVGHADRAAGLKVAPDQLFQVGSITKMMTALAAWTLVDEGKLDPEATLAELMPEIMVRGGAADKITLRHLLNHTSGLPRSPSPFFEGGLWTNAEPGAQWAYSNLAYKLAGLIVSRTDGRNFPEAVEGRVLTPLGMENSSGAVRREDRSRHARGYQPRLDRPTARPAEVELAPWVDYDWGSGCVSATTYDMEKFLSFLLRLAEGDGAPILSPGAAARFLADPADAPAWAEGARYGNGIARVKLGGRDYLHHTGGVVSFSSSLHVDPQAGVAAFASTNMHYARSYRPRDVTLYACEVMRAAAASEAPPAPKPTAATVKDAKKYAGVFTAAGGAVIELHADGDLLRLRIDERESELQPAGENAFAGDDPAIEVMGLDVEFEAEKPTRVWIGETEYLADPGADYTPVDASLAALSGLYQNDGGWDLPARVYVRGKRLRVKRAGFFVDLHLSPDGGWRGEDDTAPAATRFDGLVDGKMRRMVIAETIYERRFS